MQSTPNGRGKSALKLLVSLTISALCIWLTVRGVKWEDFKASLASANYWYLLPYALILVAIHFTRVVRWGILLEPAGKPTFTKLNSAGAIGFMALLIMPLRLGEFARPLLIAEKGKIRTSAAMASVVVERVVDGLAMALVLVGALLFVEPANADEGLIIWARRGGVLVFAAFFLLLLFLVFAFLKRELACRLTEAIIRPLSPRFALRARGMLEAFIGALRVLPSWRKGAIFAALTVFYWGINGFGMALLARGFGLFLDTSATFTLLGILVVGVMIPAGPGMLGTFQGSIVLGMSLFYPGAEHQSAIQAYAWVLWAAQFAQMTLFGLYYLVKGGGDFSAMWRGAGGGDGGEALGEPSGDRLSQA